MTEAQFFILLQISWMVPNMSFIPISKMGIIDLTNLQQHHKLLEAAVRCPVQQGVEPH